MPRPGRPAHGQSAGAVSFTAQGHPHAQLEEDPMAALLVADAEALSELEAVLRAPRNGSSSHSILT